MIDMIFKYLWWVLACAGLVLALRAMAWADKDMHGVEPPTRSSHVR